MSERLIETLLVRVDVNDPVVMRQKVLTIFDRQGELHIDLNACLPYCLALNPCLRDAQRTELQTCLEELNLKALIGLTWDDRLDEAIAVLRRDESPDKDMTQAIRFLLGRGMGLTPSGDDVLMGYGIALHLRGKERRFVRVLQKTLAHQTTEVSTAYLRAMMAGHANQGYCELAQAAIEGRTERFSALLGCLQEMGHTSGNDGLFGFSLGLNVG